LSSQSWRQLLTRPKSSIAYTASKYIILQGAINHG
jgi:hypothetical protein